MKGNGFLYIVMMLVLFSCDELKQAEYKENDIKEIRDFMLSYTEDFKRADWPGVIKKVHPDVFKYVSSKEFEKGLKEAFSGEGYELQFTGMQIDSIYPVIEKGSTRYSLVMIKLMAEMQLTDTLNGDYTDETLNNICEGMKTEYGNDFISCTTERNKVNFVTRDVCYVIYLEKEKKWFCITKDDEFSSKLVDKIIPGDVRKKLGF